MPNRVNLELQIMSFMRMISCWCNLKNKHDVFFIIIIKKAMFLYIKQPPTTYLKKCRGVSMQFS